MLNSSGSDPGGVAVAGEIAVAGEGAHHHDRAGREGDVAEGDLLDEDTGGEGGDRLEAQCLLYRLGGQLGPFPQQLPLVGVFGEQPDRVRELALGGVDAADQNVQHEVHALDVGEPLALLFGVDQQRDQVLARAARAARAPAPTRTRRTRTTACSIPAFCSIIEIASNWRWIQLDQWCSRGASSSGAPIT